MNLTSKKAYELTLLCRSLVISGRTIQEADKLLADILETSPAQLRLNLSRHQAKNKSK